MSEIADALELEIAAGRREISSDGYSMSIGELTNLYRDGELIIRPAFQRLFRWDEEQRSRLIESILLGIPLPSIFVAQDATGKWELVDGLQRVSTILQLQGLLTEGGQKVPPLKLRRTRYLDSLEGLTWDPSSDSRGSLSTAQQLDIKRSKIDIKIIKRESSPETRYDLFQRLNSYGSQANAQEIRSALIVSVDSRFQTWLEDMARSSRFATTTALSDKELGEQYDLELALRFLVLHSRSDISQSALRGRGDLIDAEAVRIATNFDALQPKLETTFITTFDILAANGPDVFRRWDPEKASFVRGFLSTAFEVIAMGLGFHVDGGTRYRTDVLDASRELWGREEMRAGFATGLATEGRLAKMLPMGRALMAG